MQGALEWIGMPYTGSGVLASALTMDKLKTKRVVVGAGYAAPEYAVLSSAADLAGRSTRIGLPHDGQARDPGIERRHDQSQSAHRNSSAAYAAAQATDPVVFAESFVSGDEFTVSILQGAALPAIRILAGDRVLRLPGQVFPRRHPVLLPQRLERQGRG